MGHQKDIYKQAMNAVRQIALLADKKQAFKKKLNEAMRLSMPTPVYEHAKRLDPKAQDWIVELMHEDPVWKRVWIMQEVSCAPRVILTCGYDTLDWLLVETVIRGGNHSTDAFHSPYSHVREIPDTFKMMFNAAQVVATQRESVVRMQGGEDSTLLDVLARFTHTLSTDPRDKIYALLGLVSDRMGIKVDYSKSAVSIYTDVALVLITSSGNLDILCQSPWTPAYRNQDLPVLKSLPNWVPDFRATKQDRFLFAQRGIYAAGCAKCAAPCVLDRSTILLNGRILGHLNAYKGLILPKKIEVSRRTRTTIVRAWAHHNLALDDKERFAKHDYDTGEDQL